MTLQVDGNSTLSDQEIQLQTLETFFVEVIDYQASTETKNDITTKDITDAVSSPLRLRVVQSAADVAQIASGASAIVFDRVVFVSGQKHRMVAFRL